MAQRITPALITADECITAGHSEDLQSVVCVKYLEIHGSGEH